MLLSSYLRSQSIRLFNCLQAELKRLKRFDLETFLIYNNICKIFKTSIELDKIDKIEIFINTRSGVNDCSLMRNNLEKSGSNEKMVDPKKQTVTGLHAFANASLSFLFQCSTRQTTFCVVSQIKN